jgi:DNA-binding MarR family transcriptional regulator
MATLAEDCAREVLDVVPQVMLAIRSRMRSHRTPDLSVPQFRTLAYLDRREGSSLSGVAEYIGLTLPSMSKLIEGLVDRDLVIRESDPADRRRVRLCLTMRGRVTLQAARAAAHDYLAGQLACLSEEKRLTITEAMNALRVSFSPGAGTRGGEERT